MAKTITIVNQVPNKVNDEMTQFRRILATSMLFIGVLGLIPTANASAQGTRYRVWIQGQEVFTNRAAAVAFESEVQSKLVQALPGTPSGEFHRRRVTGVDGQPRWVVRTRPHYAPGAGRLEVALDGLGYNAYTQSV